jgi:Sec-independent protein translocase protein TatA
MKEWIVIAVLYVLVIGTFRWLGGFGSAGDAIRRWGRSNANVRPDHVSPSSY